MDKANELYRIESIATNRKPAKFPFMHCFVILERSPKWRTCLDANKRTSSDVAVSLSSVDNNEEQGSRPMGVKKAKSKRKFDVLMGSCGGDDEVVSLSDLKRWGTNVKERSDILKRRHYDQVMLSRPHDDPLVIEYFHFRSMCRICRI